MLAEITRKSQIDKATKREITETWVNDYEYKTAEIVWKPGSKEYRTKGTYHLVLDGEPVCTFLRCDNCEEVYEWLPGNVYDSMEKCPTCGLDCEAKATQKTKENWLYGA